MHLILDNLVSYKIAYKKWEEYPTTISFAMESCGIIQTNLEILDK